VTQYPIWILVYIAVFATGFVRAILERKAIGSRMFHIAGQAEIAFISALLFSLIGIGFLQIVLRNFFHTGILWADPMMRHLVLWIGCAGAALATAHLRHINIDVFSRLLPRRALQIRAVAVHLATTLAATTLAIAAVRLVVQERAFGEVAMLGVQTWTLQLILPLAFLLIAYRSAVNTFLVREPNAGMVEDA